MLFINLLHKVGGLQNNIMLPIIHSPVTITAFELMVAVNAVSSSGGSGRWSSF